MIRKLTVMLVCIVVFTTYTLAQNSKEPLHPGVWDGWKEIKNRQISNNGKWVSVEINPFQGDGEIQLFDENGKLITKKDRGAFPKFSSNSDYLAFRIRPQEDTIRQLKLKKTKADKMPKDTLAVFLMHKQQYIFIDQLKDYKQAIEKSSWMAINLQELPELPDTTVRDSSEKKPRAKKVFDKKAPKGTDLIILNPVANLRFQIQKVISYDISRNGKAISYVRLQNDTLLQSSLFVFDTETQKTDSLTAIKGLIKKVIADNTGQFVAYIASQDTAEQKSFVLYMWNRQERKAYKIMDTLTAGFPKNWTVAENGNIYFSRKDARLFFEVAPKPVPEPKDTLLPEEKIRLDLWSWTDTRLQPRQLLQLDRDLKRSYLSVYHIATKKAIQLADSVCKEVETTLKGDGNIAISYNSEPYEKVTSWELPGKNDVYIIDISTGRKTLLMKAMGGVSSFSSTGKYLAYFNSNDSNWYATPTHIFQPIKLTAKANVPFYIEDMDIPVSAYPYGTAGWTASDQVLIYDRYDIWLADVTGKKTMVNLTNKHGRENKIKYRYQKLDLDEEFIAANFMLQTFGETNKYSGFSTASMATIANPVTLIYEAADVKNLLKAKDANAYIYTKSSFHEFPEVWYTTDNMTKQSKFTSTNPQQENYLWGNVELYKWITPLGTTEEGLLYLPENLDPTKKYPMIVYFYELSSDELFMHYAPRPSRSIINPTEYTSNGYIVFIPNIRYKEGYPGQSAYEYIMSGTLALLNQRSYIDVNRLGMQGQSWGGYQVAYLITQTSLFKAASAGAPVSNMISAYGGIRWESGMSRMFQYENTQSRIGGTLWERPMRYIENSPIFYVDRITTPLLIRHNDGDGAVPWYQGIELFTAMRRLDKPVWMLNYNGGPHNERENSPNRKDLSIRMMQFFDYYLKDAPPPAWLIYGIPATQKGKYFGYELLNQK